MDKREKLYRDLKKECQGFLASLYRDETKIVVFGQGNLHASIVLVGEAPGEQETLQQTPFVGKAGRNLDSFLEHLQIRRQALYITNVVKFRPIKRNPQTGRTSNRPPDREEIALCRPFLLRELALVRPKLVVTLGNVPLRALGGDAHLTIGACHGRAMALPDETGIDAQVFPLYHPASIIYNRSLDEVYRQDLAALADYAQRIGAL